MNIFWDMKELLFLGGHHITRLFFGGHSLRQHRGDMWKKYFISFPRHSYPIPSTYLSHCHDIISHSHDIIISFLRHNFLAHLSLKTSCSIGKTQCGIPLSHPRDLLIPST